MANDRLYIASSSGKSMCIAKHYGGEWHTCYGLEDALDDFFDDDFRQDGRGLYYLYTEFCDVRNEFTDEYDYRYTVIREIGSNAG